ncbi:flagellar basal body P-ring protein FlgI [Mesorhizobium sp. L-8-3]|uniref:flagellar basal body P-ring protein FlgI n=1 Tax=Mesorhizobium sp. L-8-3 TaxID=2744522 RepID=UPI00192897CD|nr:flagellar basal body P-ring protein FlgI [Mesorhizobium sp. L-8-3]BCH23154.1 flagellar P-ring protein [Mesorhizobium sp. L-8-3]
MKRTAVIMLAVLTGLQPAIADGLSEKAVQEYNKRNGPDASHDPDAIARMFQVSSTPSDLPRGQTISRIKDIASLQASRDNQLVGYGLVIGLQGTGDSLRNSPFTDQSIKAMLQNLGVATEDGRARAKNVAAVIVTANLPAYVQSGARIDVGVSSLGDATSLLGGTLVMTPLRAANGEIYAVAQGSMFVAGFSAQGEAETLTQGVPTSGRVPNGAIVERAPPARLGDINLMTLQLFNPDFSTAVRIADAINAFAFQRFGRGVASEQDSRTVLIKKPANISAARFIAELENLPVGTDMPARVVVDERSGTIVIGQQVKISKVAVSHGKLTVRITEMPKVSQPLPFSNGVTAEEPYTVIEANQQGTNVAVVDGPDLETLVNALNRIGVKPDGIIAILQGIKTAGALQADLVVQ